MDKKLAVKQLSKLKKLIKGKEMRLAAQWPKKWQILISTIISAQTRDETTIRVCETLFKKYPSMKKLAKARESSIKKLIRKSNYHKTKSKNILVVAKMLSNKKIPDNLKDLIKLPGVGRKVANVYLAEAHNANTIGVDTHVARISFKLGWTNSRNPQKIEKDLERLFPEKYWIQINKTMVIFGKNFGRSKRREDKILENLIKKV
tara:strand:- start:4937 stop:5548 length:612 start_codon:yes stop_codon:yes gene_type:complete